MFTLPHESFKFKKKKRFDCSLIDTTRLCQSLSNWTLNQDIRGLCRNTSNSRSTDTIGSGKYRKSFLFQFFSGFETAYICFYETSNQLIDGVRLKMKLFRIYMQFSVICLKICYVYSNYYEISMWIYIFSI